MVMYNNYCCQWSTLCNQSKSFKLGVKGVAFCDLLRSLTCIGVGTGGAVRPWPDHFFEVLL